MFVVWLVNMVVVVLMVEVVFAVVWLNGIVVVVILAVVVVELVTFMVWFDIIVEVFV